MQSTFTLRKDELNIDFIKGLKKNVFWQNQKFFFGELMIVGFTDRTHYHK